MILGKILLLFIRKIVKYILIIFLLLILCISLYALYDSYQIYESVKIEEHLEEIVEKDNSIEKLFDINNNIVGYIKIDNTSINYPILKGKDNIEYLSKNYKNEYSFSGSIFLDYRNNNFNDNYSIVYGHNLYRGGMFSDIRKYKDEVFFNNHISGKLYTKNEIYNIRVISYGIFLNNDENIYNIKKYNIKYILKKSKIKKNSSSDKYMLLSTCKGSTSPYRIILLCELKSSS